MKSVNNIADQANRKMQLALEESHNKLQSLEVILRCLYKRHCGKVMVLCLKLMLKWCIVSLNCLPDKFIGSSAITQLIINMPLTLLSYTVISSVALKSLFQAEDDKISKLLNQFLTFVSKYVLLYNCIFVFEIRRERV
jgi:hypothetical protein